MTFQALSDEDRRLWLDAMDGKEPVSLSVCLSVCVPVFLSVCLSVRPSLLDYLYVCMFYVFVLLDLKQ